MKQPTPSHQVLIIIVIESGWRPDIQRGQIGIAARSRASCPARGGELRVDVGVVVDPVSESGAAGLADRVAAGECRHVTGVEAFGGEHGDQS